MCVCVCVHARVCVCVCVILHKYHIVQHISTTAQLTPILKRHMFEHSNFVTMNTSVLLTIRKEIEMILNNT